jgi:hypothetical protein
MTLPDEVYEIPNVRLTKHVLTRLQRISVTSLQVVQSYRLLERIPAAAMSLLVQHLLQAAGSQQRQQLSSFSLQRKQLEQQLELHKHSLHPSMLSVARCGRRIEPYV